MGSIQKWFRWLAVSLTVILLVCGCSPAGPADAQGSTAETETVNTGSAQIQVTEDGEYSTKEEVALYLHIYAKLPFNYITKKEADKLGWDSKKGNLWDVAPGKSIGGSHYGNYEKVLPEKKGRKYYECDINYDGKYRGAERIIYSDDGLIYYTDDHYKTFELLYD